MYFHFPYTIWKDVCKTMLKICIKCDLNQKTWQHWASLLSLSNCLTQSAANWANAINDGSYNPDERLLSLTANGGRMTVTITIPATGQSPGELKKSTIAATPPTPAQQSPDGSPVPGELLW